VSAHWASVPECLAAVMVVSLLSSSSRVEAVDDGLCVVPFKALEALRVVYVRAIEQHHWLRVQSEVANGAVLIVSLKGLDSFLLPELAEHGRNYLSASSLGRCLFGQFLLHHPSHIGHVGLEQSLGTLDIVIDSLYQIQELSSLFGHVVDVLFANAPQFVANVSFPDDVSHRFVPLIFHSFVESITSYEAAYKTLHLDD